MQKGHPIFRMPYTIVRICSSTSRRGTGIGRYAFLRILTDPLKARIIERIIRPLTVFALLLTADRVGLMEERLERQIP